MYLDVKSCYAIVNSCLPSNFGWRQVLDNFVGHSAVSCNSGTVITG
jgi:hypothetical protein